MKYGGPAGAQVFLDVLVFHVFVQLVGRLGEAAVGATTLTVRLNMVAFLPMMGLGQAVSILVGQRLGRGPPRPGRAVGLHRAEVGVRVHVHGGRRRTCSSPGSWSAIFEGDRDPASFAAVAAIVPTLLACAAVYSVADAVNVTFSFALRGAGDTRFVSLLTFAPGLADHGGPDVPGGPVGRQHLLGLGVRDGVHRRHGRSASSCGSGPGSGRACG